MMMDPPCMAVLPHCWIVHTKQEIFHHKTQFTTTARNASISKTYELFQRLDTLFAKWRRMHVRLPRILYLQDRQLNGILSEPKRDRFLLEMSFWRRTRHSKNLFPLWPSPIRVRSLGPCSGCTQHSTPDLLPNTTPRTEQKTQELDKVQTNQLYLAPSSSSCNQSIT